MRSERAERAASILRRLRDAGLGDRDLPAVRELGARLSAYVRGDGWSGTIPVPEHGVKLVVKLSLTRDPEVRVTALNHRAGRRSGKGGSPVPT